jgi:hypothetical protein
VNGDDIAVTRVGARDLNREVVRFASRIDEVRNIEAFRHFRRELFRKRRHAGMQIDRRGVLEAIHLIMNCRGDLWMAVPTGNRDDARKHVEVPLSRVVEEPLHVPFDDHDRLPEHREDGRVRVLLSHRDHFFARGTVVFARLEIRRRHFDLRRR